MNFDKKIYDIMVLGGGPAGLAAAIYAGRAGLSVLVIERGVFGGAVFQAAKIANYPGVFPGESGADMAAKIEAHADAFGANKVRAVAKAVSLAGDIKEIVTEDEVYKGRSLIIATGSSSTKLGVPGEDEFAGRGVSYCAVCDGPFFGGLDVYVVGGSYNALEESLYLAGIARSVTIIHQRAAFQAARSIVDKVEQKDNISFMFNTSVTEVGGDDFLTRIETQNVITNEKNTIRANAGEVLGLFVFAGIRIKPSNDIFGEAIYMEDGYIATDADMHTNIPGVFAAGDVRAKSLRQIVTAAADGAIAAVQAEKYLLEGE